MIKKKGGGGFCSNILFSFREADVKAEHFERKVQQFETLSVDQEKKVEELKAKIIELQAQLDQFNDELNDI